MPDGYVGRTVIAEVVTPDWDFFDVYKKERAGAAERYWMQQQKGVRMVEHGFMKMLGGVVDALDLSNFTGMTRTFDPDRIEPVAALAAEEGFLPGTAL